MQIKLIKDDENINLQILAEEGDINPANNEIITSDNLDIMQAKLDQALDATATTYIDSLKDITTIEAWRKEYDGYKLFCSNSDDLYETIKTSLHLYEQDDSTSSRSFKNINDLLTALTNGTAVLVEKQLTKNPPELAKCSSETTVEDCE